PLCDDVGLDSQELLSAPGTGQPFLLPALKLLPVPDCRYPPNLPNGPYSLVDASEVTNSCQLFPLLQPPPIITTTDYTSNTGGPGPNSQFMFTGDVYYFTDADGNPAEPPAEPNLIENPDPLEGTNNFYTNDHFGDVDGGSTGVAFTNCSDHGQPGVKPIMDYL